MKRTLLISSIFLIASIFAACSNATQSKSTEVEKSLPSTPDEIKSVSFPETYEKEFDNITFHTDLVIKNKDKINDFVKTSATLQVVDQDKAFEEFFSNLGSYDTEEIEAENEKGEKVKAVCYRTQDGTALYSGPGLSQLTYINSRLTPYVYSALRLTKGDETYNADKYSLESELPFATRAVAFADVKDKLSNIGIEIGNSYKAYSLDYKTMQQEEYSMGTDGEEDTSNYKESWSADDECYYFIINQEYNSLPVYSVFAEYFKEVSDENTPIQIIYSKNGIESISTDKMFSFSEESEKVSLAEFDKIAQTVVDKYSMILGDSSYNVKSAVLYYMVDTSVGKGTYKVNPVWILDIEECTPKDGVIGNIQMVINAVTAEEIE